MTITASLTGRITGNVGNILMDFEDARDHPSTTIRFSTEDRYSDITIHSPIDGTPADLATLLRILADGVDRTWHAWLDDNADVYMLDVERHIYTCCDGYFEHRDNCTIRAQIDAARRALLLAELPTWLPEALTKEAAEQDVSA